jgi:hypothetical protein
MASTASVLVEGDVVALVNCDTIILVQDDTVFDD